MQASTIYTFLTLIDDFFFFSPFDRHEKSGNEQLLTEISKWVFHERGHLKVRHPH